jgi:glycosyltransferase involved in cell wall biosynthesis
MNILIINHNGGSIYHGPNLRTYYVAKELVTRGHKVTIASSSFSHKYSALPRVDGQVTSEKIDGINYKWIKCIEYKSLLQRIYSHFEFGVKLLVNRGEICSVADLVIFSGPPPEIFLFARKLAKHFDAPIVSDFRDLWPLTQLAMNKLQWANPYIYFLYICQYIMVQASTRLVSSLPGADSYFSKIGANESTIIIENGFDVSRETVTAPVFLKVSAAGTALNLDTGDQLPLSKIAEMGKFVIGYSGSFDRANDVDSLLEAASRLSHKKDLLFMFVGAGVRENDIKMAAKSIPNLLVCENILPQLVPNVLAVMDVCYCGLKPKNIYGYGVSLAKSYEYMAASKPIIWMIEAYNNPVKESGGGFVVEPGNVGELVKTINQCASLDKRELTELGGKGYKYLLENFSYSVLGDKWETLVSHFSD